MIPVPPEATLVAGCDEVGRGTWAGPVVSCALILDPLRVPPGLADSKTLSPRRREALDAAIREACLDLAIGIASAVEIDRLNILQATLLSMQRAVAGLHLRPSLVLVDGNRVPRLDVPARAVVGGDATQPAISAASIVAKVWRDARMAELDGQYPGYGFGRHFGYGTAQHLQALRQLGACAEHRHSFAPLRRLREAAGGAPRAAESA
ncbi:ribonuclease HII [Thiomonas sp.]|jgi:ribonuclease HII|uniref:ribonuclease HII n=1 Tax=Thiomonas sp. TaxID=2047785 RepID=UPI002617777B|nr:ribonuclease HII [Thiomonas sp.]